MRTVSVEILGCERPVACPSLGGFKGYRNSALTTCGKIGFAGR